MVIDDSQMDRYVAQYNIKKTCFAEEIIMMESAKAALEYIRKSIAEKQNLPDFIFLDIRMPEIDGFQFLEEYSKLILSQAKPILMMLSSSLSPEDHRRAAKNEYVEGFISKPLDKEKLQALKDTAEKV